MRKALAGRGRLGGSRDTQTEDIRGGRRGGGSRVPSQADPVGGASDPAGSTVHDMGVDHGRADVTMTEKLLDRPDVVVVLQKVRREGVAESIRILLMNRPRCGFATGTIPSSAPRFTSFVPSVGLMPMSW